MLFTIFGFISTDIIPVYLKVLRACLEASQKIEVSKFRTSKMGSENAQQTDKYDIVSGGIPKHRTFELSYFPTI
jgi:hypothetical protein